MPLLLTDVSPDPKTAPGTAATHSVCVGLTWSRSVLEKLREFWRTDVLSSFDLKGQRAKVLNPESVGEVQGVLELGWGTKLHLIS